MCVWTCASASRILKTSSVPPAVFILIFLYENTAYCRIGYLLISKDLKGVNRNRLGIRPRSLLCLAASFSIFSTRSRFGKWNQVKGRSDSENNCKTEWEWNVMMGEEDIEARSEKECCLCHWGLSKRNSHSKVVFCFCCVLLCSGWYRLVQGQSSAAFCSLCKKISQIPEMNTCEGDEVHGWFQSHRNPQYNTQSEYCRTLWTGQISSFVELAQSDRYQVLFSS